MTNPFEIPVGDEQEDGDGEMESVTLVIDRYGWTCPHCEEYNLEAHPPENDLVTCADCGQTCQVGDTLV